LGKHKEKNMILRIWHGWTTPEHADVYEALLKEEIFIGIQGRHIPGFEGIQLLRREAGDEVEFVTVMRFDSLGAVREFAGEDHEVAVVPEKARAVLSRFDERSQHYELRAERDGDS
jgi:antibiotic biosynthesis monooxygenase (ABM) superfamily enzyme